MHRDIDTTLLRAFVVVAETGGMTSAGRILNLTQAAVSQQIKRLEELFGTELFDRSKRQIALSAGGERLLSYAQRIISLNDEIYGLMTSPEFEGEVRLGVPHDLLGTFVPPILKSFAQAWPRVQVTLVGLNTPILLERLNAGEIDLTLTTEITPQGAHGALFADQLVWAGAKGGEAYLRQPLPLSMGCVDCAFRTPAIEALRRSGQDWRLLINDGHMEPMLVMVAADLAIAVMLTSTLPDGLQILPTGNRLPDLPKFYINLHVPEIGASDVCLELARHIRHEFATRFQPSSVSSPSSEKAA